MLHSVEGCPSSRARYCGPSALSIITGLSYMETLMLLKAEKQKNHPRKAISSMVIKGTDPVYMRRVLTKLGYRLEEVPIREQMTFAKWLRSRSPELRKEMVLIVAGNHYMVTEGNKACDGIVREPVFISKMKGRRKRMETAHIIVKADGKRAFSQHRLIVTKKIDEEKASRGKAVAKHGAQYREVAKAVKELGMEISTVQTGYEFEILAKDDHSIDGLSHLFRGDERWQDAVEWLRYLKANGIVQERASEVA